MNTMKIFLLGLTMVFAIGLQAQTTEKAQTRQQSKEARAAKMQEQRAATIETLNLSATQVEQFDAINEKYRGQMQELRQSNGTDRKAVGQQMRELRNAQQEEIKAMLTPAQVEIFEAELAARRESRRDPCQTSTSSRIRAQRRPSRRRRTWC